MSSGPSRRMASVCSPEAAAPTRRELAGESTPCSPALFLTIPVRAEGKQRARRGRGGVWYTPERTRQLEALIAAEWMAARLGRLSGPLSLRVVAEYAPPKSWPQWRQGRAATLRQPYTGRIDHDNCAKLICDALNGVAYADDRQIAEATIRQIYAPADRLTIELREMA